jgi:hypothetical protein
MKKKLSALAALALVAVPTANAYFAKGTTGATSPPTTSAHEGVVQDMQAKVRNALGPQEAS